MFKNNIRFAFTLNYNKSIYGAKQFLSYLFFANKILGSCYKPKNKGRQYIELYIKGIQRAEKEFNLPLEELIYNVAEHEAIHASYNNIYPEIHTEKLTEDTQIVLGINYMELKK